MRLLGLSMMAAAILSAGGAVGEERKEAFPNERMLEWADCEIGVIIHHDIQAYEPEYDFRQQRGYTPKAEKFNPSALDTDQWLEVTKSAGAKYAVLAAKHCSGFSLWPTKAHGYSVASSPWKGGKGDVVADFMASCRKFGVRPGVYASTGCNAYMGVDNNELVLSDRKWSDYLSVVKTQLTELWTNYGELFEVWFDGGNLPVEKGGKEIEDLLAKLQPKAVVFQGNPKRFSSVRWIGNERAHAPETCWARVSSGTSSDGVAEDVSTKYSGQQNGIFWCPGEADVPNRDRNHAFQAGWFWRDGEDDLVYSAEQLLERYFTSVGRNCNMLIGVPIDNRGRIPDRDAAELKRFGELVRGLYRNRVATAKGQGCMFTIEVPAESRPNLLSVQEDLTQGENIRTCTLSGFDGKHWHTLADITNIGHRRLVRFTPGNYQRYRFDCWDATKMPSLRDISLYEAR